MTLEMDYQKRSELSGLTKGDKVRLTTGETAEFVRLKQKKFIGIMRGASYDIPVTMFKEVVEKVDRAAIAREKAAEYTTLKYGEPFFINHNGNAELFTFHSISNGRIVGINPITKSRTRIDTSFYAGKVSNIEGVIL